MLLNIKQNLRLAASFLCQYPNPNLEAEALLMYVLGQNRAWLKTHGQENLSLINWGRFRYYVWQRSRGIPLAYIRGYQDWHGQKFLVNKSVLIPRDETETLLQHIISSWKLEDEKQLRSILDVGTGSGCLAIELQRAFPKAKTTGLDISKPALKVALKNAHNLGMNVEFKHSDLLSLIPKNTHYDLIVANLPYVPTTIEVTKDVAQEPRTAIFSGTDGLDHIRRLASELNTQKITFDHLWLEFLPDQKSDITQIFGDYTVEFKPDVAGNLFFARVS